MHQTIRNSIVSSAEMELKLTLEIVVFLRIVPYLAETEGNALTSTKVLTTIQLLSGVRLVRHQNFPILPYSQVQCGGPMT